MKQAVRVKHHLVLLVAGVLAASAACTPTRTAPADPTFTLDVQFPPVGQSSLGMYTGLPPLLVQGSSYSRDDGPQTWSVYCVAARDVTTDISHLNHWIAVQVSEHGADGPDGYWKQGRPCPSGPILMRNG